MEGRLPAPPVIRPEEMADIVAYLYSLRYFAQAGDPHNGARLLVNRNCLDCHGLHGQPGKSAGDLARSRAVETPGGVLAALWNHAFIDPGVPPDRTPWPLFRGEEIADLVAYLRSAAATR
jgi:mono/diheme cytochrome c family protein